MARYNEFEKLAIIGAGGFAREVLCLARDICGGDDGKIKNIVFVELDELIKDKNIMGSEVIPRSKFNQNNYQIVVAIGDPLKRKSEISQNFSNANFVTLVHPSVVMSDFVTIGEGAIICAGSILTCNIKVGIHAHINLHTSIGHDCVLGDYFTSAPGVRVSGNCTFGSSVYVGTNASLKQGLSIADNVTIGMGAVVVKNITEEGVYIGNPAVKMNKRG